MPRRVWKAMEAKAKKTRIVEAEERRKKRRKKSKKRENIKIRRKN